MPPSSNARGDCTRAATLTSRWTCTGRRPALASSTSRARSSSPSRCARAPGESGWRPARRLGKTSRRGTGAITRRRPDVDPRVEACVPVAQVIDSAYGRMSTAAGIAATWRRSSASRLQSVGHPAYSGLVGPVHIRQGSAAPRAADGARRLRVRSTASLARALVRPPGCATPQAPTRHGRCETPDSGRGRRQADGSLLLVGAFGVRGRGS